ncbi:MAG: hypothetical protein R3217_08350 [Gammaproteobacteria bacterium]|nr:hypothetical protein [Gammaproteobacteria bacterium]
MRDINWRFQLVLLASIPFQFIFHELAHWLAGTLQGYDMIMTLNTVKFAIDEPPEMAQHIVTAAGPLFTILVGVFAWWQLRRDKHVFWYAALYYAVFMRLVAMLISASNPNDEARLSIAAGLGTWTLPAIVVLGLLALTIDAARRRGIGWKPNLGAYFTSSIGVTAIVFADRLLFG